MSKDAYTTPTLAGSLVEIYRRRWLAGDWRVTPVTLPGLVLTLRYLEEVMPNESREDEAY